jgi:branched-subunit amino acid transport protein AzlD
MLIALLLVGLGGIFAVRLCYARWCLPAAPANYEAEYEVPISNGDMRFCQWQTSREVSCLLVSGTSAVTHASTVMLGFVPIALGMPVIFLLMPVFAKDVLGPDYSFGLGLMLTATGVGALIGSFFIAALDQLKRRALLQLIMGTIWGLSLIGFAVVALLGSFPAELVLLRWVSRVRLHGLEPGLFLSHRPRAVGRVMAST